MVGRHSSFLVTKRSLRNSDSNNGRRLRQVVQTKNLDDTVGLSRKEEQELNKALYASLQENRRTKALPGFVDSASNISSCVTNSSSNTSGGKGSFKVTRTSSDGGSTATSVSGSIRGSSINKSQKMAQLRKRSFLPGRLSTKCFPRQSDVTGRVYPTKHSQQIAETGASRYRASLSIDESSQDSVRSSTSSNNGSKRKIHAQRKFAQGCSLPGMMSCSPVKLTTPAVKMLSSKVPKTEDFLTFLCLRGSSILPPHLDFFNFSREEPPSCEESSRPVSYTVKNQREDTPDSSSTSSGANEEVAETANVSTPTMKSPLGAFTPVSSSGRSVRSASPTKMMRRKELLEAEQGTVRSARKSLFGKPQSIVQKQARRIVGKSTGKSSTSWQNHVKKTITRSGGKKDTLKPEGKKRKRIDDSLDEKNERRSSSKRPKREPKVNRRVSTRLREMMLHTKLGTSRSSEAHAVRNTDKDISNNLAILNSDERAASNSTRVEEGEKANTSFNAKPRRPYKIRPLERVRTRAYSLLLASKLALKRARRENVAVKQKTRTDNNVYENQTHSGIQGKKNQVRTRTAGEKQQAVTEKATPEVGIDSQVKTESGLFYRSERTSVSSSITSDHHALARGGKDSKERMRFSAKRTSPKKAKVQSSPSRVQASQNTSEENSIPTFHPTEAEFSDPIIYINQIQPLAEPFGMCRVIPPPSWKLDSNKISNDIRFTSQVQHIHRLYQRWGPNVQHSAAINHHLLSEMSDVSTTPQIGGIEIDLSQLHQLVEEAGGPKKMNDKKHWARIADIMNIPKQALDRTMRIYDIYCRHVFPYATLSPEERKQLEDEVKAIHDLQTVEDEAVLRGKSMPVSWFNRIARNVQFTWFKEDATPSQIESRYWHIVEDRTKHVAVQCGHINTRTQASGFPTRRESIYSRHPWNLNNVLENPQCILKYLGPVSGVTIPTLHMNMLFSTSCWSADPHSLPYIQYVHTGADIIWYCIPKSQHSRLKSAMTELTPSLVTHKPKWLKEDCVMVNPKFLKAKGLRVGRCVQSPRQFVVVFPGAFTSTISCGYSVAESVHYATARWLPMGMEAAMILSKSGEKELFSMSTLLCGLALDDSVGAATLSEVLPLLSATVSRELELRAQLQAVGLRGEKSSVFTESPTPGPMRLKKMSRTVDEEKVCDVCERICYLSMVLNELDEQVLCLEHGIRHVQRKKNVKSTRLFLRYNRSELETIVKDAKERIALLNTRQDQVTSSQENKTRANIK